MDKPLTIGVDIGGTKLNVALVDRNGRILSTCKSFIHPRKGPEKVIAHILTATARCQSKTGHDPEAIGIGVAAQVDTKGVVRSAPNLGWQNFPLKQRLEKELEMPVLVTNDVNAATWGEWRFGSGKGVKDLVVLFVGTGVGGGIITGGKLLTGCTNTGGELGHMTIVYDGRKCHCPNRGCLEAYASGWAIAKRAQEAVRTEHRKGEHMISLAGSIKKITAVTVSQAYREDDLLAQTVIEETGRYLAAGVISIVNAFNPCVLALGGGVIEGIPELIQMVNDITQNRALEPAVKDLKIVKAVLGVYAGTVGAADLAQDLVDKAP